VTSRNTNYQRIPLAGVRLERPDSMSCSGYMLGGLQIGDQKLHIEAIRLHKEFDGDLEQVWHTSDEGLEELESSETEKYCACDDRYADLGKVSGQGRFTTQRISGHEGDWVLYATPYLQ
jgi:hypothetical protein